jgi:hypothetical protein
VSFFSNYSYQHRGRIIQGKPAIKVMIVLRPSSTYCQSLSIGPSNISSIYTYSGPFFSQATDRPSSRPSNHTAHYEHVCDADVTWMIILFYSLPLFSSSSSLQRCFFFFFFFQLSSSTQ